MSKRVKVSREEFAEFLLRWFAMNIGKEGIKQAAKNLHLTSEGRRWSRKGEKLFGLDLSNRAERMILAEELIALNQWIIVRTCERTIGDVAKRNDCLNIFHRRLFDQFFREIHDDFRQWVLFLNTKYDEYMEACRAGIPMMRLADVIHRNLHGDVPSGATGSLLISTYIVTRIQGLEAALEQFEIE